MKRIILASLLFATPALAQPAQTPTAPGQRAWEIMFNREVAAHQSDLGAAVQLSDQVDGLKKQVADLTKERDDLKAKAAPPAATPAP